MVALESTILRKCHYFYQLGVHLQQALTLHDYAESNRSFANALLVKRAIKQLGSACEKLAAAVPLCEDIRKYGQRFLFNAFTLWNSWLHARPINGEPWSPARTFLEDFQEWADALPVSLTPALPAGRTWLNLGLVIAKGSYKIKPNEIPVWQWEDRAQLDSLLRETKLALEQLFARIRIEYTGPGVGFPTHLAGWYNIEERLYGGLYAKTDDAEPAWISQAYILCAQENKDTILLPPSIETLAIPEVAPDSFLLAKPNPFRPRHSTDFSSVQWTEKETYYFTRLQAACVEELWENAANQTPDVRQQAILAKVESESKYLHYLFKKHPAWNKMIVRGEKKGTFRLSQPVSKVPPSAPKR